MKHMYLKNWITLLVGCFFILSVQNLFASTGLGEEEKKKIPLQGKWFEDKRSIEVEYPVSVSWDGTCLYVVNLSPRSTIHVTLSNGAENICDETIPAGTCPATIYVGTLESGQSYQLVLTNQFGDRLEGTID